MGSDAKMPKQGKAKRDGVINQQYYNFNEFKHGKYDALKTLRINRRLFLNFNYLVSVTADGQRSPPMTHVAKFYGRLRLIRSVFRASYFPCLNSLKL